MGPVLFSEQNIFWEIAIFLFIIIIIIIYFCVLDFWEIGNIYIFYYLFVWLLGK